jgi:acyl-CoA synthetase (NDP forming)
MVPPGVEVVVAANRDPVFGPMISLGPGGTLVDLSGPPELRPGRLDRAAAREMAARGTVGRLLAGYRGRPPADLEAVVDCLVAVSGFAADNRDRVAALEINPLIVHPAGQGAVAADALLVVGRTEK